MNLTTAARVYSILGLGASPSAEAVARVAEFIATVSADAELHMGRHVQSGFKRTEVYHVPRGWRLLALRGAPIASISTVRTSTTRDFSASELLTANEHYILEDERGTLRFVVDLDQLSIGAVRHAIAPTYVQVSYDGGMAADTDAFVAAYPALAGAVDLQVAYLYKRSDQAAGDEPTGKTGKLPGGSYDWLPVMLRAIESKKRRLW